VNERANHGELTFHELLLRTYEQSRSVAACIRSDVLPELFPSSRLGAERLLRAIASRRIFNGETLVEIEVLTDRIGTMIRAETDEVECWDNDPHDMSGPACWMELHRTEAGEALSRARDALTELDRLIAAVLDHRVTATFDD
jgi:hypothetical protein